MELKDKKLADACVMQSFGTFTCDKLKTKYNYEHISYLVNP